MDHQQTPPPGWYPDHRDPALVRLWNGREWTQQTAPANPPAPHAPRQTFGATAAPTPGPWKRLRLRTKALLVVVALVMVGLLVPDQNGDTSPVADRQRSDEAAATQEPTESADAEPTASDEPIEEEPVEELTEEPVEEVVEVISMPALRSQSIQEARKSLRQAGMTTEVVKQPSWDPAGTVLEQDTKAGAALTAGAIVTLVVAAPMPRVPGVVGRGAEVGRTALVKAGFKVVVTTKEVPSGASNVVLGQTPAATQQAAPGSVVRLVVSKVVAPVVPLATNCTTGYEPCLAPATDYDCAGGSGDGPAYATGPVYITGSDPYDLDNDGDGVACES